MKKSKSSNAVLCYVKGPWAYFTTQPLDKQWGDDWDDIPYEHNAGEPYEYSDDDKLKGRKSWKIIKIAWEGRFDEPCDGHANSPWNVKMINAGMVAWLRTGRWHCGKPIAIPAGTTLVRFCELIQEGGGKVYVNLEP